MRNRIISMQDRPEGAVVYMEGLFYKPGHRGRVYYWDGIAWLKSSKDLRQIVEAVERKENPFSVI